MKRTKQENDVEIDADQSFLDQVLNTLYDFGDGADGKRSKRHKKRKKGTDVPNEEDHSLDKLNCGNDTTDLSHLADASCAATSTTSNSEVLDRKASHVEIVTFQDPLKKTKLKRPEEPQAKPTGVKDIRKKDLNEVITIEKARLDVHRFGITGFQKQQQRVFEQDRAIMLGARPPKKEYMNYKLYQQVLKEKRMKEKEEATSELQKKKKRSGKQKSVKPKSSMKPSGQVGNFKNGMLVLSSKDLQKFNGKVRKGAR